jgi:hypothetical protein
MISLELLQKHGLTEDNLKKWLAIDPLTLIGSSSVPSVGGATPAPKDKPSRTDVTSIAQTDHDKRIGMLQRHQSRIMESLGRNFSNFRVYYAVDQMWDQPLRSISPTLIKTFLGNQDPNSEEVYKAAENWGLTHLIETRKDPKTGKDIKTFNLPMFFEVVCPLVRSYVTIRLATIVNQRRLTPFFKYEPVSSTTAQSIRCKAITDRVQIESNQYGYFDVMKQAVLKMLMYSACYQFPKEEWHWEEQAKDADELDVLLERKKENGEPASVGDEITVRTREGIRYHLPHPTRVIRDLAHGPYTLNYDCGCEYGGYWRIARYREILNSTFWNKEKIALGTVDLVSGNRLFFTTVYSACTLTIPVRQTAKQPDGPVLGAELGLGAGDLDRERQLATLYYGTQHGDQGVLVTEFFEKLVPADNGLGTYKHPVWFRFVYAGDCCTCLYAAPLPYCPIIYYGYDADESREKNASLAMEIAPFQDHFSNVLTQILHTAKENLANLTFVDTDQLDEDTLQKVRNMGDSYYRWLNIFGYSSRRAARGLNRVADVVTRYDLPKGNVAELINVLREVLNILERVLVMSSQEIAQAASHELRVDEVRNIAQSTSNRLQFTATPVDIARDAWKRQLYQGLMAYSDPDWFAQIPAEVPLTKEALEKMGFNFEEPDLVHGRDRHIRARIKKHKTAVPLWEFASTRDGEDRIDNAKTAQSLALIVQSLLQNPMTAQAIGPDQALDLANNIMRLAGMPMDIKLRNMTPAVPPEQQQAQAQQQLQQVVQQVLGQVNQEIRPLLDETIKQGHEIALISRILGLPLAGNGNGTNGDQNQAAVAPGGPGTAGPAMAPARTGPLAPGPPS